MHLINVPPSSTGLRHIFLTGTILSSFYSVSLAAQVLPPDAPPIRTAIDENGIDLASGEVAILRGPEASIGDSQRNSKSSLSYKMSLVNSFSWVDEYSGHLYHAGDNRVGLTLGNQSRTFTLIGETWVSDQRDGWTMTTSSGIFTFTSPEGSSFNFGYATPQAYIATLMSRTEPSGERIVMHQKGGIYNQWVGPVVGYIPVYTSRIQSITSNRGYQIKLHYESDYFGPAFTRKVSATLINNSSEYCDPLADSCSTSSTLPDQRGSDRGHEQHPALLVNRRFHVI